KTAIDKNTADIATNKDNIAANKTAIDKNAADIATNKTSIANVSGQVDALQKDSATVKDAATLINKNADAINNIGQYENRLSKAEKDLKTVTQISNNNAAAIGSDTNGTAVKEGKFVHALRQNTEDPLKSVTIGTNLNALDDAVGKANQQINTNKTDIATNKADIAQNKTDIATNKTDIATNKKAINDEAATRQAADQNLQNQINNNSTSINDLYGRYSSLKTDINKVGARSAALAGLHPLDFDPANKLNFAVASGSFKGENSVALGAFYRPNENIMFSAASTMGDSDNAYTFGLSFKIGPSSAKTKTTSPDAEELYKVVGELQDQLAAQQKEIEQLKADKAK
uniref:YadA C-terminal domain-containing protein n=1 Tax=Megasphaera sp. TaxID=2023260 RepID=UPI003FEE0E8C